MGGGLCAGLWDGLVFCYLIFLLHIFCLLSGLATEAPCLLSFTPARTALSTLTTSVVSPLPSLVFPVAIELSCTLVTVLFLVPDALWGEA